MAGVNRIPRFSAEAGRLLRRSGFLVDGWLTYFGPGQRPDVINGYYKPNDWRQAGSLLVPPRVVWLNVYHQNSGLSDPILMEKTLFHDWQESNADFQEHVRLIEVFLQVKAKIEAIQDGKTWVQIIDWGQWSPFVTAAIGGDPVFESIFAPRPDYRSDGYLQIAAPPSDPGDFFGVDFLNVWCGDAAYDDAFGRGIDVGQPLGSFNRFSDPKARLIAAYKSFARHATFLYGPDQSWSPPEPLDGTAAHVIPYEDFSLTQPPIQSASRSILQSMATELADFGCEYTGGTSGVTSDSLTRQIADHFRFDPDTGKDL